MRQPDNEGTTPKQLAHQHKQQNVCNIMEDFEKHRATLVLLVQRVAWLGIGHKRLAADSPAAGVPQSTPPCRKQGRLRPCGKQCSDFIFLPPTRRAGSKAVGGLPVQGLTKHMHWPVSAGCPCVAL